jgi:hypothetical protein
LLPSGQPAVGAEVTFRGQRLGVSMTKPGEFFESTYTQPGKAKTKTGEDGRFRIRFVDGVERLAVAHPVGWANEKLIPLTDHAVWLNPWGRIEGVVRVGGRVWPGIEVQTTAGSSAPEQLLFEFRTKADAEGRFEFPRVPGGLTQLALLHQGERIGIFSHPHVVTVKPGQTTTVTIGGSGARLIGRIITRPEHADIGWNRSPQHLNLKAPPADERRGGYGYGFFCREDGSFVVEDVPPGEYRLDITANSRIDRADSGGNVEADTLGFDRRDVIISPSLANGGELDLGVIEIKLRSNK